MLPSFGEGMLRSWWKGIFKIKIHYNFETTKCKLKIQKAKFVRIKFPIELSNFYLTKTFFVLKYF